jgi:hypothetical protein
MPAAAEKHDSPSRAVAVGSFPADHRDLPNMTPEQWEEWDAVFGPEPNIPEDY